MALSGSYDFTRTADQLIEAALRKLQVLAEGQSASTNQKTYATEALNVMLKAWQADGMPIWYTRKGYIYPVSSTNEVQLSSASGGGHASEELILTKLTADAAANATSLTVSITAAADVTGTTANSDNIGIELDDGTMFWTTISSGGGTTALTVASGITSAASSGNRVYAYTTKMERPEAIVDAWRIIASSDSRIPLTPRAMSDVRSQAVMSTASIPLMYNYQETLNATKGLFTFWPRFANGDTYIEIRFQQPFDDIDTSSTDNISFPLAWYEAVIYNLADRLAPEYGFPLDQWQAIKGEAMSFKAAAEEATTEGDSIFFQPEYDPTRKN